MKLLDNLRAWLDRQLRQKAPEHLEARKAATTHANRRFNRHGPMDADLLPGSPRARLFRRGRRR